MGLADASSYDEHCAKRRHGDLTIVPEEWLFEVLMDKTQQFRCFLWRWNRQQLRRQKLPLLKSLRLSEMLVYRSIVKWQRLRSWRDGDIQSPP